jgi:hypothetical protein
MSGSLFSEILILFAALEFLAQLLEEVKEFLQQPVIQYNVKGDGHHPDHQDVDCKCAVILTEYLFPWSIELGLYEFLGRVKVDRIAFLVQPVPVLHDGFDAAGAAVLYKILQGLIVVFLLGFEIGGRGSLILLQLIGKFILL